MNLLCILAMWACLLALPFTDRPRDLLAEVCIFAIAFTWFMTRKGEQL